MKPRKFFYAAAMRAIKTAAQAALGVLGSGAAGVVEADWKATASIAAMAAILSFLNSLVGLPEVSESGTG